MKKVQQFIFLLVLSVLITTGCKKTISYQNDMPEYMPMYSGKTITYRLDSTNFTNYGTDVTVTSYAVQDIVDSIILDNLNRPSWRVFRYISDTAMSQPWTNLETYLVTPTRQTTEVFENNLRFIKLSLPLTDGFSWLGNSYIDTNYPPPNSNDPDYTYLANWNYTYSNIGTPYTVLAGSIPNTLIVNQQNNVSGDTSNRSTISTYDYSVEVYAKGIGLIYKKFLHQENQPPNGDHPQPYSKGYGIELNMINHN
ncbi:MAG: hypothetical protein JST58_08370 [Bacteroidetes bacterium]|nr:hypothetical protein [Bacteroidota bacterium]